MKLPRILLISAPLLAGFETAAAAVTLDFTSDLQGFQAANFGGNNNNSSVTWDANGGNGRMQITNTNSDGNNFAWIAKYFTNSGKSGTQLAMYNELAAASLYGGTISYDVTVVSPNFTGPAPGYFQVNFFADNQNGGFDQEYNVPGTVAVPSTTHYTLQIQKSGAGANDDDKANFQGSTGAFQFGFGSNYNNSSSLTYYVDNFRVASVVTLTASDYNNASTSFNSNAQSHWSIAGVPSAGNTYSTGAFTIRTPNDATSNTFGGDSLSVETGGRFLMKGTGTQTYTVPLILNGGYADQANTSNSGTISTLAGTIAVNANSGLGALVGETLIINSTISGSSNLTIGGPTVNDDAGTVVFAGTNSSYSGAITVAAGTLLVNNTSGTGAVSVSSGAKLGGTGSIGGATTISSGGIQTAGTSVTAANPTATLGKETFTTGITYNAGSIFEWNLTGTGTTATPNGSRGTDYDAVNTASLATNGAGAIFRVVLNSGQDFGDAFWNTDRTWSDIFTDVAGTTSTNISSIFGGGFQYQNSAGTVDPTTQGAFTISGTSLNWTAVPEPSSALAGLLITAGLLRRRRTA